MDVIGTRLNETVNKSTAGIDFKQKKGVKKNTGWSIGEAVVRLVFFEFSIHELADLVESYPSHPTTRT
jgi:hypothetical protein